MTGGLGGGVVIEIMVAAAMMGSGILLSQSCFRAGTPIILTHIWKRHATAPSDATSAREGRPVADRNVR